MSFIEMPGHTQHFVKLHIVYNELAKDAEVFCVKISLHIKLPSINYYNLFFAFTKYFINISSCTFYSLLQGWEFKCVCILN